MKIAIRLRRFAVKVRLLMCSLKELKANTIQILNRSIAAITKILFSLPLVPQLYSYCTSLLNFLIRYLFVRHAFSPPFFIINCS